MADIRISPSAGTLAFTSSLGHSQVFTQDSTGAIVLQGSGDVNRSNLFAIDGINGRLFSVDDSLSDTLFSVNTIAGLPVIEAFADNSITMGQYGQNVFKISGTNVGIGTSSPTSKLEVRGNAIIGENSYIPYATSNRSVLMVNGTSTSLIGLTTGGTESSYIYHSGIDLDISQLKSGGSILFRNAGLERMRISGTGNVGIGTTGPSNKTHILDSSYNRYTLRLQSGQANNAEGWSGIGFSGEGANTKGAILFESLGLSYSRGKMIFALNNETNQNNANPNDHVMTLIPGGNVGIGTTSPSYKLDVAGTTRSTTFLSANATNSTGLEITSAIGGGNGAIIRLTKDAADRQIYQSFEGDQLYLGLPASNTTLAEVGTKGSVDLRFATAYSERMRITSAGNVGIGTTNPSTKLDVSGVITATGGNSTNWNTAYDWGNHAGRYMTEGLTLTGINTIVNGGNRYDPSTNNPTNEHYAVLTYGNRGNVTGQLATHFQTGNLYSRGYNTSWSAWRRYWNSTDFSSTNISNWNTAYGWGNHASQGYATQTYVNTAVSNLVASAPGTLDTLNELAAALGDDPNFATTVTNSIATKLPLAGGTLTGGLSMNSTSTVPISITGASHKYLTINPGNGYEAMVRYLGGTGSSWYVGKRNSTQLVGSQSFHFYSEAAGASVGGITPGGAMYITDRFETTKATGTMLSNAAMTDAIGWNGNYGMYIGSTVGGTSYLYANGTLFTGGVYRTLIHSGNIGSQTVANATNMLPLAGGTLTGGLAGLYAGFSQGIANNVNGLRLLNPGGGSSTGTVTSQSGAIKITLPVSWTNTMMRMTIKVYEYATNEAFTLTCGGYNYGPSSSWVNEFAYIESSAKDDRNFTVRFGHDGTKCCIYIGELNTTWSYPQVFVTEFEAGYQSTAASTWRTGWNVGFETSTFGTITKTVADTQVHNWVRSGANVYYGSGAGNVGIGTTNPAASLDITKVTPSVTTFSPYIQLSQRGTVANSKTGISFRNTEYNWDMGKISTERNGSSSSFDFVIYTALSGADNERIRITSTGNVGIGTTSPQQKLHVEGNIYLGPNNTNNFIHSGAHLGLQADGEVKIVSDVNDSSGGASSDIVFGYGSSTNTDSNQNFTEAELGTYPRVEVMRIDTSTDRVGIGTISPGTKLDVSGVITATGGNSTNWNTAYSWGNHASAGYQAAATAITTSNIGSQSVNYATTAGSATSLDSSNFISRVGTSGNANTDFQNTPPGTFRYVGDHANITNSPGGTWWVYQNMRHSNGSNLWGTQVAWGWEDNANKLATRNITGGVYGGWVYYLNSSNFTTYAATAAQGANATTAYSWGNHASAGYILKGSTIVHGASWSTATKFKSGGDISQGAGNHSLQVYADINNDAFMAFHISGDYAVHFGLDNTSNRLYTGGWSDGTGTKYQIWDGRDFSSTNITNWNTAYGWGNHASAGYQAAATAITTSNIGSQSVNYATTAGSAPNGSNSNTFYNVTAGNGNGVRFWASDNYKISMGASALYYYGPVTDYSIKTHMDDGSPGRGFTWGRRGYAPIAAINSTSGFMQIAGTFVAGGDIIAFSDARVKENIETVDNALDKVLALRGVSYNRTDVEDKSKKIGVIAQEVRKILPEVVQEQGDGTLGVSYGNIVGVLIEAIKEQQKQIDELKALLK